MRNFLIPSLLLVLSLAACTSTEAPATATQTKTTHNYNKPVPHAPGVYVPPKPGEPDNTLEPDNTVGVGLPYPRPSIGSMSSHGGGGGHR